MFHHPSMLFQQCWKVLKYFFSNTAMVLNWHHSRLDLYWIQSGVNLLHRCFYSVGLIEYRSDDITKNFFFLISVFWIPCIGGAWWKTSTAQIGWESVHGGPEIWPHGYLISPIEISVNWPGSKQLWTRPIYIDFNGAN